MDAIQSNLTYILFYNVFIIKLSVSKIDSKQEINILLSKTAILFYLQNILQRKSYINLISYKR